jgi:hypothetical protein
VISSPFIRLENRAPKPIPENGLGANLKSGLNLYLHQLVTAKSTTCT